MIKPLSKTRVSDLMEKSIVTITTKTTFREAAATMVENNVSCLVVVKGAVPVSLVTERSFVYLAKNNNIASMDEPISASALPKLLTIAHNSTFSKAFNLLNTYGYKQLPVVKDEKLVGLLTLRQLLNHSRRTLIDSMEENRTLQKAIHMDELTGVFNKRFLQKRIVEEYERAKRYAIRTSVIFVDIDFFKKVNDTYSHACGDYVLKTLGKILKKFARSSDVIARYGGEEFVIITPYTNAPEAAIFAHKIRVQVENYTFKYKQFSFHLTISAGVCYMPSASSALQALDRADKSLYMAKNTGRNRVCRWSNSKNKIIDVPYVHTKAINLPDKQISPKTVATPA